MGMKHYLATFTVRSFLDEYRSSLKMFGVFDSEGTLGVTEPCKRFTCGQQAVEV